MNKMILPPDVEFHEDIRLLVWRPRGLLNKAQLISTSNTSSAFLGAIAFFAKPFADNFLSAVRAGRATIANERAR